MMRNRYPFILLPLALWVALPGGLSQARPAAGPAVSRSAGASVVHLSGQGRAGQQPAPKQPARITKGTKQEEKASPEAEKQPHHRFRATPLLIPPPPPTLPGPGMFSGLAGAPVELMSPAELKRRQKDLAAEVSTAGKELSDKEAAADEMRKRSTLFASLYTEGVVSRKELEASQKEDAAAQDSLKAARARVETLVHEQAAIKARLDKLAKGKADEARRPEPRSAHTGSGKSADKKLD